MDIYCQSYDNFVIFPQIYFSYDLSSCLRSDWIKKVEKSDPIFFQKMAVFSLQLFDFSAPKAPYRDLTAREYSTHNHSYENSFKHCKISYNLIKFCRIWEFKVSKESRDNFLCFCTLSM